MSRPNRSPYAEDHWALWEMEAFELPADHPNAPKPKSEELDMVAILAEIDKLRALAIEQGKAEGYAVGHQQGIETGRDEGFKEGFEQGENKGHDKGYKEGYEAGSVQSQGETAKLAGLAASSAKAINHLHEELGQALLALAVDVAQHVLQTELREYPEHLIPLIKEVLKDVEQTDQAVTLALHPDDLPLVEQHLAEDLAHNPSWRLKADETIRAGGVEVKSTLGQIDATLETRWRRALSRLGPSLAAANKNTL